MCAYIVGLKLTFYIEDNQYIDGVNAAKGIRIVFHPFNTYAPVADYGISLAPGFTWYAALRLVS